MESEVLEVVLKWISSRIENRGERIEMYDIYEGGERRDDRELLRWMQPTVQAVRIGI